MLNQSFKSLTKLLAAITCLLYCSLVFSAIENQQLNITELKHKINITFEQLNAQIENRKQIYLDVHQDALDNLSKNTLNQLRTKYSSKLGMDVDLYIINDDLVIAQTTFDNDLGLDFKAPFFKDAQYFMTATKKTGLAMVSNPTLELSTHQYKIYSWSTLPTGGYLEIGFTDPEIAYYFNQAKANLEVNSSVISADIYLQYEGLQVSPLTITSSLLKFDHEKLGKLAYLEATQNEINKDVELFKSNKSGQITVHKNNDFADTYNMYLSLGNLNFIDGVGAFIICKLKLAGEPKR